MVLLRIRFFLSAMTVFAAMVLLLFIATAVLLKVWCQVRGERARIRQLGFNRIYRATHNPPHGFSSGAHGNLWRLPPRELLEGDYRYYQ